MWVLELHLVSFMNVSSMSMFWMHSKCLVLTVVFGFLWKEWCYCWNSSTLATSCEELTHWKRLWCWEGLGTGGEGDDRGWDCWMASLTRWTWVWVNSGNWWWTGGPGMLRFMGSQKVGHDWATELKMCNSNILIWSASLTDLWPLEEAVWQVYLETLIASR